MSNKQLQQELDGLREELTSTRRKLQAQEREIAELRRSRDVCESEVSALHSGKPEARKIAEASEIHAAESAHWKARYVALAVINADLDSLLRHYETSTAPQMDLIGRVTKYRQGQGVTP